MPIAIPDTSEPARHRMTKYDFWAACHARTIAPELALECPAVVAALRSGDYDRVLQALDDNF